MIQLPPSFLQHPIAHRALHDITDARPENSRAAIRAALSAGYGIEIDVQLSADRVAMVFHDYDLGRLTGTHGAVAQRSQQELAGIPLTGGDEGIPDLTETLNLIAGKVPLLIEIKDQDGAMGSDIGPLETAVADALASYTGPVALMSFNPHSVARMADLCPSIPRGLVTSSYDPQDWPLSNEICAHLRHIPDFDRVGASFISHEAKDLNRPRVHALKRQGASVLCWTVRSPMEEATARKVAQNITFEGYLPAGSA
ncbi:MAG: glycerophosphodiester phosphodiesterase family protein [Pseudomonadota bacterium]